MEAIILAGGFGTRIQSVVSDVPKPMAPVCGKPFLHYILQSLEIQNIDKIILAVGFKNEVISNHFGNKFGTADLLYSVENTPLGTGGAIRKAIEMAEGKEILIINGDTFFGIQLKDLLLFHQKGLYDLTMCLKPMENFDRYGTVIIDNDTVTGMKEKQPCEKGLINGGVYVLNKGVMEKHPVNKNFSFEKEVLEKEVNNLRFGAFVSDGYFIDIGIPEDYKRAQRDFRGKSER